MLFNSLPFAAFLVIVFSLYWLLPRRAGWQNLVLLVASLVFYGWWDKRCLALFVASIAFVYAVGLWIDRRQASERGRNLALSTGIAVLLGILGVFKYCNFFLDSINDVLLTQFATLKLILPLGISFYTFIGIGYLVDVYKRVVRAERNLPVFALFMGFFPQVAAGPIGRAKAMLPQFASARKFDFEVATHGLCLIAYGLFKKVVVADLLALYGTLLWREPEFYGAAACIIGAVFYSIQIYCDFSGYSDIARGIAQLLGIELMLNFNRPYLSTTFGQFWHNWHISLSTWFRDYLYIPLGGSRCWLGRVIFNTWVVFVLSGLWHGAAWTFVVWGCIHAVFLTLGILRKRLMKPGAKSSNATEPGKIRTVINIIIVNIGVAFAWIFFRAPTFAAAVGYLKALFAAEFKTSLPLICAGQGPVTLLFSVAACCLLALSYLGPRDCKFKTAHSRFMFIAGCIAAIVFMGMPSSGEFIYFQF